MSWRETGNVSVGESGRVSEPSGRREGGEGGVCQGFTNQHQCTVCVCVCVCARVRTCITNMGLQGDCVGENTPVTVIVKRLQPTQREKVSLAAANHNHHLHPPPPQGRQGSSQRGGGG